MQLLDIGQRRRWDAGSGGSWFRGRRQKPSRLCRPRRLLDATRISGWT